MYYNTKKKITKTNKYLKKGNEGWRSPGSKDGKLYTKNRICINSGTYLK